MRGMHLKSEIAQLELSDLMLPAERVGFEPTVDTRSTTVFETAPFGRSGTSPVRWMYYSKGRAKFPL